MSTKGDRAWPWLVDVAVALYVGWVCHTLALRVPAFQGTFADLGAQLPDATSFLIRVSTARNLYILAGVIVLVLVAKNIFVKSAVAQLGISVVTILLMSWSSGVVTEALMQPMLHLMSQLGK
jgi:type II secretory pathway component PulF